MVTGGVIHGHHVPKVVNGPTGGQGTVGRQALSDFLITTFSIGLAEDIFSVQLDFENLWLKLTRDYVNLKRPTLRLHSFHLCSLPTSDQC